MTDQSVAEVPPGGGAVAERVRRALAERAFRIVYQPIIDLTDGRAVAVEALSRFTAEPYGPPDCWFADAWQVGVGAELELAAFEAALGGMDCIPAGCRVAINLSPSVIAHPDLLGYVQGAVAERVVIELTEHVAVPDYDRVRSAVAVLRAQGARLAVDDMGAGFASFRHIVQLEPDIIKLDRELVHDIDADPVRRSVVTAMVAFAADVGSDIVAEGIETQAELEAVRDLRIRYGQGMLIGEPQPPPFVPDAVGTGSGIWSSGAPRSSAARSDGAARSTPADGAARSTPAAGAARSAARCAHDDDQLAAASSSLAWIAEAIARREVNADAADVAVLGQAAAALARIASQRRPPDHLPVAEVAPWS